MSGTRRALSCGLRGAEAPLPHHGFSANRRWGNCARADRVAAPAVLVPALHRQLSRSYKHRLRHAWDEGRVGTKRLRFRHSQWDLLYRLFCAASSRRAPGGTLERTASPGAYTDHLGRAHWFDCVRAYAAAALRRPLLVRCRRGRVFSGRNRLSVALVSRS